jgi:hypothetical protein
VPTPQVGADGEWSPSGFGSDSPSYHSLLAAWSGPSLAKIKELDIGLTSRARARLRLGAGVAQQNGSDYDEEEGSKDHEQVVD